VSIHCFSTILIKREVELIKISVLLLKDSAYFADWYSYKYGTEISDVTDLESTMLHFAATRWREFRRIRRFST